MTRFKICGLSTPETVDAAVSVGAFALGFVFFPRSPRHLSPEQAAGLLGRVPEGRRRVAVLGDAEEALSDRVLAAGLDTLQSHGAETPERIAAVAPRPRRPVWRAAGGATQADIRAAVAAAGPAEWLLLDAKAPRETASGEATLPGGNGLAFDWRLLQGTNIGRPWGLGGGLAPGNVAEAIAAVQPGFVDVSSGVESRSGVKSVEKIKAFAAAVMA
ncbi:N-(5'-phosphoribosyl)anthranilate isomerase [Polymorphobacter multimanifer]|uniref:phosphoribosylanthranilate isomerase n=1 Tax=Polymorphobacter multimanifer TaxID=1070431 RepID=UPI00166F211E|nr:phosphoribosylanthranilate isomerase [Polymorphobacter multimanifer]GGI79694.1 N-(5'-phosphoribosyl)anthranilate isomerase [Polymorphobacter multimanifer]